MWGKKGKQEEILKISNYLKIPYFYYTLSYVPSIICHFMGKKIDNTICSKNVKAVVSSK